MSLSNALLFMISSPRLFPILSLLVHVSLPSDFDMAVGISKLVEKFEAAARSQHACPVCYRGFSATEEDKFVADVSGRRRTLSACVASE